MQQFNVKNYPGSGFEPKTSSSWVSSFDHWAVTVFFFLYFVYPYINEKSKSHLERWTSSDGSDNSATAL